MSPDNPYVLKSYRYLRLVMVGLVVLLAASVLIELQQTGFGCWRTSISSYYWTPVRGVFVGALVAIGTCLIVLKGNTPVEDVLLNVAGALAPIVAFVPILDPKECQSTPWAASPGTCSWRRCSTPFPPSSPAFRPRCARPASRAGFAAT